LTSPGRALAGPDGAAGGASAEPDKVARTVFALLVAACFAAFFITQRLKHTPTIVQRFQLAPSFMPLAAGEEKLEPISFKISSADKVTVTIVDSSGGDIATLVRDHPLVRYKQFSLRWNGRRGEAHGYTFIRTPGGRSVPVPSNRGALAPAGEYRVRVRVRQQHREVLSPRSFTLVAP
jgi:hypothetical protein